jgi:hypothetical protein
MSVSDSKQNPYEEFFSRLVIPGLSHSFAISKEESYETGEWIYRIYNFKEDLHKEIEELTYNNIRDIMQHAAVAFNENSDLAARTYIQKLMNIWKERWDEAGRN